MMRLGERSINMARVFNYREGFTFKNGTLREFFYHNFKGGSLDGQGAINKKDFQKAVRLYAMNLWVGIRMLESLPPPAKLIELGLDWLNEVKR